MDGDIFSQYVYNVWGTWLSVEGEGMIYLNGYTHACQQSISVLFWDYIFYYVSQSLISYVNFEIL